MRRDIKLPFGLKGTRIYHITEVENGLSCGCTCPNCGTQLVAKNNGTKKADHFSHYKATECDGSLETAIHLMAKQVIKDELEIYTPKYTKPISLVDDNDEVHTGRTTHIRPFKLTLEKVDIEVAKKGYRPDVIAYAKGKALIIEIKVTHEVDEEKKELVKSFQEPMLEIDLSDLKEETLLNLEKFEFEVNRNVHNRKWINNPKGDLIYERRYKRLQQKVDRINKEIREEKKRKAKKKKELKQLKQEKRQPHLENLNKLKQVDDEWIEQRKSKLFEENKTLITNSLNQIGNTGDSEPSLFTNEIDSDWIFKVHPIAWQSAVFLKYIHNRSINSTFKANDVKRWLVNRFGILEFVEELNIVKQKHKRLGSKRDKWYADKGSWFFTDSENYTIISPFKPIIKYLNYLAQLTIIEKTSDNSTTFKVSYNSWPDYANYIHELEINEIIKKQVKENNKRFQEILRNQRIEKEEQARNIRIKNIVKSEKRAFEIYGPKARSCMKCFMASNSEDGVDCPFCGHDEFKSIVLTEEHLKNAKHKYECNTSINSGDNFVPKLDLTLIYVFEKL